MFWSDMQIKHENSKWFEHDSTSNYQKEYKDKLKYQIKRPRIVEKVMKSICVSFERNPPPFELQLEGINEDEG